jgi:3',5'-cyclic AMP phosphodiesterase CpdA
MSGLFQKKGGLLTLLCASALACALSTPAAAGPWNTDLKFKSDKTFKIVQFTDTQDDQNIDPRTVALIEAVLDNEQPDLVVFTGDNITGGPKSVDDVKKAIDNFAQPVIDRAIPWIITFGNHDEESGKMDETAMLGYYMSLPFNMNEKSSTRVNGTGNMNLLIRNSQGTKPVFGVWALDSGRYAPSTINGQSRSADGLPGWDWIRPSQIAWYTDSSEKVEKSYGAKIPSLMFFHIPLWEFADMWDNKDNHGVVGERNETECPGPFNSGLFAALLERGDVKGVFVGHDHVNTYVGNYFGIFLGYSGSAGFGTYGLGGAENNRLRGARVFNLSENDLSTFETHMVFATDYGIQ